MVLTGGEATASAFVVMATLLLLVVAKSELFDVLVTKLVDDAGGDDNVAVDIDDNAVVVDVGSDVIVDVAVASEVDVRVVVSSEVGVRVVVRLVCGENDNGKI